MESIIEIEQPEENAPGFSHALYLLQIFERAGERNIAGTVDSGYFHFSIDTQCGDNFLYRFDRQTYRCHPAFSTSQPLCLAANTNDMNGLLQIQRARCPCSRNFTYAVPCNG